MSVCESDMDVKRLYVVCVCEYVCGESVGSGGRTLKKIMNRRGI
jgi:hypothetical protein